MIVKSGVRKACPYTTFFVFITGLNRLRPLNQPSFGCAFGMRFQLFAHACVIAVEPFGFFRIQQRGLDQTGVDRAEGECFKMQELTERGFGRFSRTIRLPFAASDDKVEARMTNGVLRIVISRPEEEKPKKIEIKAA